jgi:hypothetical protein
MGIEKQFLSDPNPVNLRRAMDWENKIESKASLWVGVGTRPNLSYREVMLWAIFRSWDKVREFHYLADRLPGSPEKFKLALIYEIPNAGVIPQMIPDKAHRLTMESLAAGQINAMGFKVGETETRSISPDQWEHLTIGYFQGVSTTAPDDRACLDGVPVWSRLTFTRSDVERLFPAIGPDGVEVEIANAGGGEDAPGAVVEPLSAGTLPNFLRLHEDGSKNGSYVTAAEARAWGAERGVSAERVTKWRTKVPAEHKLSSGRRRPASTKSDGGT